MNKFFNPLAISLGLWSSLILVASLALPQKVSANDGEYEEVTYETLLNEISKKRSRYVPGPDPFDAVRIHAHIGMGNSLSTLSTPAGARYLYHNGFQLGFGIDLFSDHWFSEGAFRNYGTTRKTDETYSLREFDLRVVFHNKANAVWSYRFGGGISARYLKYADLTQGFSTYDSTPAYLGMLGVEAGLSKNVSMGLEFSGRSAMVTDTIDKSGFDMALRLNTYF